MNTLRTKISVLFVSVLLLVSSLGWINSPIQHQMVYQTNFDDLSVGLTQPFPGATGQDSWYRLLAVGDAFGEIQGAIAHRGQALHEHTAITVPPHLQTLDQRNLIPADLDTYSIITLSVDFYAHTSDLNTLNPYTAVFEAWGGPHPGYKIIQFGLGAGSGVPKNVTGLNTLLSAFNGVNNNVPIPLTVGQNVAWDTWHHIVISLDHKNDTYRYITVDGQTQDLTGFLPPRSYDGVEWKRGQLIEHLVTGVVPIETDGDRTDDDVYWDNIRLEVQSNPGIWAGFDIEPGIFPNVIELEHDVCLHDKRLTVAILTNPSFNAAHADVPTITLGDPVLEGTATPIRSRIVDVDLDHDEDLELIFSLCEFVQNGALGTQSAELVVYGLTLDGTAFWGSDSVQIVREDD